MLLFAFSDRANLQTHTVSVFANTLNGGVPNPIVESKLDEVKFDFDDGSHIYDDPDVLLSGMSDRFDSENSQYDMAKIPDIDFGLSMTTFSNKASANSSTPSAVNAPRQAPHRRAPLPTPKQASRQVLKEVRHDKQENEYTPGVYQIPSSLPANNVFEEHSTFKPSSSSHPPPGYDVPTGAKPDGGNECKRQEEKVTNYMPLLETVGRGQRLENDYQMLSTGTELSASNSGRVTPSPSVEDDQYMVMDNLTNN